MGKKVLTKRKEADQKWDKYLNFTAKITDQKRSQGGIKEWQKSDELCGKLLILAVVVRTYIAEI